MYSFFRPRMAYIDYRHVLLLDGRMDQAHFGTKRSVSVT